MAILREYVRDILAECSRSPHRKDRSGLAVELIRRIEIIAEKMRDHLDHSPPPDGKARDGIEAMHGLNDTFPGDQYP